MSNETGLISILNEAAHILYTNPPNNLRWSIIDELEGFAGMLQDGQLITQREQKLANVLKSILPMAEDNCKYWGANPETDVDVVRARKVLKELFPDNSVVGL